MNQKEFLQHIANGERWFNNGRTRNRYVIGVNAMVLYKNKPSARSTTGTWTFNFAKWAKGTGQLPKQPCPTSIPNNPKNIPTVMNVNRSKLN